MARLLTGLLASKKEKQKVLLRKPPLGTSTVSSSQHPVVLHRSKASPAELDLWMGAELGQKRAG